MLSTSSSSNSSGYVPGSPEQLGTGAASPDTAEYWDIAELKKAYQRYLGNKRDEIDEQKEARRYYHGAQWSNEQIRVFKKRKQPVVTFNRIVRKINGITGLIERTRQDPKGFPRTPQHEEGAELATAVLRYALDEQNWREKSPLVAGVCAVDGLGGYEIELIPGDTDIPDDYDIGINNVDNDGFFYDPRSKKPDFSDAMFMGQGKWLDIEAAIDLAPDMEADIRAAAQSGADLTSNPDSDTKWFNDDGKRLRLVDMWYRRRGEWYWALFTGAGILKEGKSYLYDEKKRTTCKFIMFSANVDQDGDRYGFVRGLKSAQDEINQRRSKALHQLNSRGVIARKGAVSDVQKARNELVRPDAWQEVNAPPGRPLTDDIMFMDREFDITGQLKMLEDAKNEVENFGPNPALIGQGIENKSGKAIQLLQQAGIAELGPYIIAYRGVKIRLYKALWNAIMRYWKGSRFIRVTDDEGIKGFIEVNGVGIDPATGQPTLVNALGQLDVDIILDEGEDTVTMAQDTLETLSNLLPNVAPMLSPQEAKVVIQSLFSLSPLPASTKKALKDGFKQAAEAPPDPMAERAKAAELAGIEAKVAETQSKTVLNQAKAQEAMMPEPMQPGAPADPGPTMLEQAETAAKVRETDANTELKYAQAFKVMQDAQLAPEVAQAQIDRAAQMPRDRGVER